MTCICLVKQKKEYECAECDWSSDVCSSDLAKRLDCCNGPIKYQPISNQMRLSLTKDKRQLENAINSNKDEVLITVTKKVVSAAEGQKSSSSEKELINLIKSELKELYYMNT